MRVLGNRGLHATALAVANDETMDAPEVKDHQVIAFSEVRTLAAIEMSEFDNKAESRKGGFFEELPIPLLR